MTGTVLYPDEESAKWDVDVVEATFEELEDDLDSFKKEFEEMEIELDNAQKWT